MMDVCPLSCLGRAITRTERGPICSSQALRRCFDNQEFRFSGPPVTGCKPHAFIALDPYFRPAAIGGWPFDAFAEHAGLRQSDAMSCFKMEHQQSLMTFCSCYNVGQRLNNANFLV